MMYLDEFFEEFYQNIDIRFLLGIMDLTKPKDDIDEGI